MKGYADRLAKGLLRPTGNRPRPHGDYRIDIREGKIVVRPAKGDEWLAAVNSTDIFFQADSPSPDCLQDLFSHVSRIYFEAFSALEVLVPRSIGVKFTAVVGGDIQHTMNDLVLRLAGCSAADAMAGAEMDAMAIRMDFNCGDRRMAVYSTVGGEEESRHPIAVDVDVYAADFSNVGNDYHQYLCDGFDLFCDVTHNVFQRMGLGAEPMPNN